MATSALMFTGASQFAMVAVLGAGGGALSAAATATLLGTRNAFYGLRLSSVLRVGGARRLLAAHLTIDESAAMAFGHSEPHNAGGRSGPPVPRCSCCGTSRPRLVP